MKDRCLSCNRWCLCWLDRSKITVVSQSSIQKCRSRTSRDPEMLTIGVQRHKRTLLIMKVSANLLFLSVSKETAWGSCGVESSNVGVAVTYHIPMAMSHRMDCSDSPPQIGHFGFVIYEVMTTTTTVNGFTYQIMFKMIFVVWISVLFWDRMWLYDTQMTNLFNRWMSQLQNPVPSFTVERHCCTQFLSMPSNRDFPSKAHNIQSEIQKTTWFHDGIISTNQEEGAQWSRKHD